MEEEFTPEIIESLIEQYFTVKRLPLSPAVTFDDVIVRERISSIASRKDIRDLKAQIGKDFYLNIPIISANMDTVTDSRLAITLARMGGMGFIHQFMSLEDRLEEVKKVKRADNTVIENPVTINLEATLKEAKALMAQYQISCLLVVMDNNFLMGILTGRDMLFEENENALVKDLMTPKKEKMIVERSDITNEQAVQIFRTHKLEKLPLVNSEGRLTGLITAKDILKRKQFPNAARDSRGRLVVGATLRFSGNYLEEAGALINAGADVLLLDTARAASSAFADILAPEDLSDREIAELAAEKTAKIKQKFPNSILVVGNTALPDAVVLLARAGADCIKIGVGPGAGCKTQEEAGVGSPQLHAIAECAAVAKELSVYLIGDGGIKNGGCLVKSLVAGANAVMIGSLLAGTDESPGLVVWDRKKNQLVKKYRGSASLDHQMDRVKIGDLDALRNPEGESGDVPYMGSLASVVGGLLGGLRSGMSYTGAHNLQELWQFGRFKWRTQAAIEEGKPRI